MAGYGRSPRDIGRYTWRQIQLFFDLRQAAEQRSRHYHFEDTFVAMKGGKGAQQLAKALEG